MTEGTCTAGPHPATAGPHPAPLDPVEWQRGVVVRVCALPDPTEPCAWGRLPPIPTASTVA